MILNIYFDASYLPAAKGRSRAGGCFFLGSLPKDGKPIQLNRNITMTYKILKLVTLSEAEAELGVLFVNTKEGRLLCLTLQELGHPQPQTPIHVNNTTAISVVSSIIKRQRLHAMEMRYFKLLDRMVQQYFSFFYQPGLNNLADFCTKHHLWQIHQYVRPYYLQMPNSPTELLQVAKTSLGEGVLESLEIPIYDRSHYRVFLTTKNLV